MRFCSMKCQNSIGILKMKFIFSGDTESKPRGSAIVEPAHLP